MSKEILKIIDFMGNAFLHIWPYLLMTILLAVAVNMSGASRYIKRAFDAGPVAAILLATAVGAFSPFCSCGVIPVVAALLISGVPLVPVMSFWIASPSMDPEIFFLSVATIGWNLAIWRLIGTLMLSLGAGFITHILVQKQWIGSDVLRRKKLAVSQPIFSLIQNNWKELKKKTLQYLSILSPEPIPAPVTTCCKSGTAVVDQIGVSVPVKDIFSVPKASTEKPDVDEKCGFSEQADFWRRLFDESFSALLLSFCQKKKKTGSVFY